MKNRLPFLIFISLLVCLTGFWTSPAAGKLYPPIRAISYSVNDPYSISYWTTNLVWSNGEETWFSPNDTERYIKNVVVDQGLIAWIYQYKNAGDPYYTHYLHYRIMTPPRGTGRGGIGDPFPVITAPLNSFWLKTG